jgi:hypothetical protein
VRVMRGAGSATPARGGCVAHGVPKGSPIIYPPVSLTRWSRSLFTDGGRSRFLKRFSMIAEDLVLHAIPDPP